MSAKQDELVVLRRDEAVDLIEAAVLAAFNDLARRYDEIEDELYLLKKWFSLEEAAAYLDNNVTAQTVRDYIRQGLLKGSKLGRSWYVCRGDLDALLDSLRDEND